MDGCNWADGAVAMYTKGFPDPACAAPAAGDFGHLEKFTAIRSKVRIRSAAPPLGRRYIQFSGGGIGRPRKTPRASACDDGHRHIGASYRRATALANRRR